VQIAWLNDYHRRCKNEVGQYLVDRDKRDAYDWLVARTAPVSSAVSIIRSSSSSVVWLFVSSSYAIRFLIRAD